MYLKRKYVKLNIIFLIRTYFWLYKKRNCKAISQIINDYSIEWLIRIFKVLFTLVACLNASLIFSSGNVKEAFALLYVPSITLYRKLRKFNIYPKKI